MRSIIQIVAVLTFAMFGLSTDAQQLYDIQSKEGCADIPFVVNVKKEGNGLIYFKLVYREIAPFNSMTHIHIGINNETGDKIFSGILDSEAYRMKGTRYVTFYVREDYLDKSSLEISADWSGGVGLFSLFSANYGRVTFDFNLKDLYDWYTKDFFDDVWLEPRDKRVHELVKRKDIGIKKWKAEVER